jgi:hypothetical protein
MRIKSASVLSKKLNRIERTRAGCLFAVGGALLQIMATTPALAQIATTLHNPLIPGAQSTPANVAPTQGAAPPPGDGPTPTPVNAGMTGSPTLLPWKTNVPFNNIDLQDTQINLPYNNSTEEAPGAFRQLLAPYIPPPPSTPGPDPGILHTINATGTGTSYPPAAKLVQVNANGGLPDDSPPTTRRGGQTTGDFGLTRTARAQLNNIPNFVGSQLTDYGLPLTQVPNLAQQPQESQDGPRPVTYDSDLIGTRAEYFTNPQAQATSGYGGATNPDPPTTNPNPFSYGFRILFGKNQLPPNATQANY